MLFIARLAFRNLLRNRRRTALTFSALALGIGLLIGADSISRGFSEVGVRNAIDYEMGHMRVHESGYFEDRENLPLDLAIPAQPVLDALGQVGGIRGAAPRVVAAARLNVGWEEFPVALIGIDPRRDPSVFAMGEFVDGRYPEAGAYEGLVGAGLADLLDIRLGDYMTMITRTRNQALEAIDLEVVGILRTPHPGVNHGHVYMPLDVADARLALEGRVTEVVLRLDEGRTLTTVRRDAAAALAAAGVGAELFTWQESAADLLALAQADQASNVILIMMILVIALVGVTNTMLLGALERRREIGTMKAMGMREGEIRRLFLFEAGAIGLVAALCGSLIGIGFNLYLVGVGIDLSAMVGDVDLGFPVVGTIYGVWNPLIFVWAGIAGVLTCCVAGYLPARQAAKEDPATSVRL